MIQVCRIKDREPEDDSLVLLYNPFGDGGFCYATYLAPRRGRKMGDWEVRYGGEVEDIPATRSDRWMDADFLTEAAFLEGEVYYQRKVRRLGA